MTSSATIDFRFAPPVAFTSICRPDDPHKSLVRQDGALLYGFQAPTFESWHFRRVVEFRLRSRGGPQSIRQATECARVPVVVTTIEYPRAVLTLRAYSLDPAWPRKPSAVRVRLPEGGAAGTAVLTVNGTPHAGAPGSWISL